MRTILILVAVSILGGAAAAADVVLRPAEVAAHKPRMVDAEGHQYDVFESLQAKALPTTAKAADKLVRLLAKEQGYWEKGGLDDATALARRNLAAAQQVSAAANAGKLDEARTAFAEVQATCVACHELHPENRLIIGH
jgi:hypothetical protein